MDVNKDFIQHLRRLAFDEVFILLSNVTPKLMEYVRLLSKVKFEDGSYQTFYADIKKIISSFINYFTKAVDNVIKEADRCSNALNKDDLIELLEQTISIHQLNQIEFGNAFLPITSPMEKLVYEEIEAQFNDYIKKLHEFKENIDKIPKQDKVLEFAKKHFEITVKKTSSMFNFTYDYLSLMLADCLNKVRTSLEEIHLRINNNLIKMQEESEETLNALMYQLYVKNKENVFANRADERCSADLAELSRSIQVIKNKIVTFEADVPLSRLEEEVAYWQKRIEEFNEVATNLVKLKVEQENVTRQHQIYKSMRTTELPGEKRICLENMDQNFSEQKAYLKQKMLEESRALITFFACRGTDRILYTNNKGSYYVDEYNHQVYVRDYGLGIYHVTYEGNLRSIPEFPYYFDKNGRYINQGGEKAYQCASCTSLYNLQDNDLLNKIGYDYIIKWGKQVAGGHDLRELQCRAINDPTVVSILPDFDHMSIKSKLNGESVKYLWNSFGSILPDALHDVGTATSASFKNPIHLLAHKLLYHKYKKTVKELRQKKTEAEEFQANIYQERNEKAVDQSKAWKWKPVESDDVSDRAVFDAQLPHQEFHQLL